MLLQLVHVYAVVMVLQPLCGEAWRPCPGPALLLLLLLVMVVCHGRAGAAEAERKLKRVAQDAAKPAPERHVDDEVCRRVDDQEQLADDVESHQVLRKHEPVLEVALRKRYLHIHARAQTLINIMAIFTDPCMLQFIC